MIVVDRRVAVIPAGDDLRTAIAVREPSVVAYLVDIFERTWERGAPVRQPRVVDDARTSRPSSAR